MDDDDDLEARLAALKSGEAATTTDDATVAASDETPEKEESLETRLARLKGRDPASIGGPSRTAGFVLSSPSKPKSQADQTADLLRSLGDEITLERRYHSGGAEIASVDVAELDELDDELDALMTDDLEDLSKLAESTLNHSAQTVIADSQAVLSELPAEMRAKVGAKLEQAHKRGAHEAIDLTPEMDGHESWEDDLEDEDPRVMALIQQVQDQVELEKQFGVFPEPPKSSSKPTAVSSSVSSSKAAASSKVATKPPSRADSAADSDEDGEVWDSYADYDSDDSETKRKKKKKRKRGRFGF